MTRSIVAALAFVVLSATSALAQERAVSLGLVAGAIESKGPFTPGAKVSWELGAPETPATAMGYQFRVLVTGRGWQSLGLPTCRADATRGDLTTCEAELPIEAMTALNVRGRWSITVDAYDPVLKGFSANNEPGVVTTGPSSPMLVALPAGRLAPGARVFWQMAGEASAVTAQALQYRLVIDGGAVAVLADGCVLNAAKEVACSAALSTQQVTALNVAAAHTLTLAAYDAGLLVEGVPSAALKYSPVPTVPATGPQAPSNVRVVP